MTRLNRGGEARTMLASDIAPLKKALNAAFLEHGFKRSGKAWVSSTRDLVTVVNLEKMTGVHIWSVRAGFWLLDIAPAPDKLLAHQCHVVADLHDLVPAALPIAHQFVFLERNPAYGQPLEARVQVITDLAGPTILSLQAEYGTCELLKVRYGTGQMKAAGILAAAISWFESGVQ